MSSLGGLMIIRPPPESRKEVISKQSLTAGASTTLLPSTEYKYAVILFHGDGGKNVKVDVTVADTTALLYGHQQAIEIVASATVSIVATNTGTATEETPTIEIAYINW